MMIYVDPLFDYPSGRWCHMVTDGPIKELHQFAAKIGLKQVWFQDHPKVPHYDLKPRKRALAILAGAVEVSSEELLERGTKMKRPGDWIQTYSGLAFWPMDPNIQELSIEDIAHSLAMQCRFGGHTLRFYSVAEHSILVSQACSPENALWGLLHDASEAYLVDVPRPVKPYLSNYKLLEDQIMSCIAFGFNLPWPIPEEVKIIDTQILANEREAVMKPGPAWNLPYSPLPGVEFHCWGPEEAEKRFLDMFRLLTAL